MQDIEEFESGECRYTAVYREIVPKGKGYLIIRRVPAGSLAAVVDEAAGKLAEAGADQIYLTCVGEAEGLIDKGLKTPKFALEFDSFLDRLEKVISPALAGETKLDFKSICPENREEFLHIYNDCFFSVPNSATYTAEDAERLIAGGGAFAALILNGKEAVGIFELSFEKSVPEIASLGILKKRRGQGFGREALGLICSLISSKGFSKAFLKVSSTNKAAYSLYLGMGFVKTATVSTWFRLRQLHWRQAAH